MLDHLHDYARGRGLRVIKADIGDLWGLYDDDTRAILLHSCLTSWQELSTLAHELSHARHRDRPTANRSLHQMRERRADVEAAMTLIRPERYARAEEETGGEVGAIAAELGVSVWVVETFIREADAGREWTKLPVERPTARIDFNRFSPSRTVTSVLRQSA